MTSKERVLKTIAHEEPDRVPIGEWGIDHDHVSRILGRPTFWRNRRATTLALWQGRRDEVVDGMKRDLADLVEALDYDVLPVGLVPPKGAGPKDPPKEISEGVWQDSAGRTYKYSASNDSIQCLDAPPVREELTDEEVEAHCERLRRIDETRFELVDYIGERFGDTRAVVFRGLNSYFPLVSPYGGTTTDQLMMMVTAPEKIRRFHEITVEHNRLLMERCVGHGVMIAMQARDYGTSTSLILSPRTIRDLFMPVHKDIAREAERLGLIPFFHCCGRVWDILDDWVDAGMKGYQSIQGSAGMDLETVKARYGHTLTLWAGVQCETLIDATIPQVEQEVTRSLEVCMPGGGFLFGATNSVQFGAKTENYLRALELVRELGSYA